MARSPHRPAAVRAFERMMEEASRPGFYGTMSLHLTLQDGHVQQVKISSERQIR